MNCLDPSSNSLLELRGHALFRVVRTEAKLPLTAAEARITL